MDWLPSVPTLEVINHFCRMAQLPLLAECSEQQPNLLFYPIKQETELCAEQLPFIECIHPATSIPAALLNFLPLTQNTPEMRGIELMSDYRMREIWNTVTDFQESPLLYCYYSIFKNGMELSWDGYTAQTMEQKIEWLQREEIPYVAFRVEKM